MTTVSVVRKGTQLAIAADSLVTFGDTKLPHGYEDNDKLFKVGESYFGMAGTTAHFPVLRKALATLPKGELKLTVRFEGPSANCGGTAVGLDYVRVQRR